MQNSFQLIDCLDLLRSLPDASVDFLCVDPPYHTTALAFDKAPRIDWAAWWREANRVVKPAGVVCIFASTRFTFELYATNPKAWRYTLVWEKTRRSCFQHANRRPLQAHEEILVFCRKPKQATYNPQKTPRIGPSKTKRERYKPAGRSAHLSLGTCNYTDDGLRHPGTVLRFASADNSKTIAPTQKPVPLLRWLVRSYSNADDLVLDCCAGSGSTGAACLEEGRRYVLGEYDPAQYERTKRRLQAWQPEQPARPKRKQLKATQLQLTA